MNVVHLELSPSNLSAILGTSLVSTNQTKRINRNLNYVNSSNNSAISTINTGDKHVLRVWGFSRQGWTVKDAPVKLLDNNNNYHWPQCSPESCHLILHIFSTAPGTHNT